MSLHDYIKFEYPLPEAEFQNKVFSLDQFSCDLNTYVVTKAGRLVLQTVSGLFEEAGERLLNPPNDTEFHGDLTIWGWFGKSPKSFTYSIMMRLTEGQLMWLKTEQKPTLSYRYLQRMMEYYPDHETCVQAIVAESDNFLDEVWVTQQVEIMHSLSLCAQGVDPQAS